MTEEEIKKEAEFVLANAPRIIIKLKKILWYEFKTLMDSGKHSEKNLNILAANVFLNLIASWLHETYEFQSALRKAQKFVEHVQIAILKREEHDTCTNDNCTANEGNHKH
jgi:hypothetical protein